MTRRDLLATAFAPAVQGPLELKYRTYTIRSEYQLYGNSLRLLDPDVGGGKPKRVLYVLPVNPDVSQRWGDGFETLAKLGLHAKHGFVLAAPSFSAWPWYADHPVTATLRQETYFVEDVVKTVDRLYPGHDRLLVGFSKSGNGAYQLLLRHPELFRAAAAWDAPLMKEAPDQFGMGEIYGTKENFAQYAIGGLLEQQAAELRGKPARLALMGFDAFREHTRQAHERMDRLAIPHRYDNVTRRVHRWDSGWLEGALSHLDEMTR